MPRLTGNPANYDLHRTKCFVIIGEGKANIGRQWHLVKDSPELQREFFSRMVRLASKQNPERDIDDIRTECEMWFMERGLAIPSAIDMEPQRPEPIEQEGPLTAPVKLLEQTAVPSSAPAPQSEPESAKQDDSDEIKELCIRRLQRAFPNLRRADVLRDAEKFAIEVRGKIQ